MKRLHALFYLLLTFFLFGNVHAQSQDALRQLMRERGEYYFTLTIDNPTEGVNLGKICSVDGVKGNKVVCYANQQEYDKLLTLGYEPELQTPPSLLEEAVMWDGNRATYEWDSYPTYSQYESMMQAFPISVVNGRICTYMELGTLSSGRKIMGVRINNGSPDGKPKFLYSSTIHGDETTGWIMLLRLIDELCTSSETRIVNLVDSLDIFIFPNTNPDGTYYGGNNTVTGARRANANNVDMNRNYPDPHGSEHPDGNAYQTETQWFMTLAETYPFAMAANYHGGAEVVNYPWDNTNIRHADDAWWQYVSQEYADLCHAVSSSYLTTCNNNGDTPSGITNGADWYMIGGGRQDYMNGYRQCREVTVECSNTKNPSAAQLPNFWNYNHNSMLALMEQCLNGVHGVVYDATINQPIDGVTVTVLYHDDQYSIVSTHQDGDFHRPIKGGRWTFKFTKDGYCDEFVHVVVADDKRVDLQVFLTPEGDCPIVMECYEQTMPTAAGEYVMGYLNGSTLVMPTHNSNSSVTATSVDVTPTVNGFSVEVETLPGLYTLTAYGNNQYYISYNGRYLARSNYGTSLTWGTSTSQNGRWYINRNGIYVTRNNTNYYLYYNNGSFQLSTSQQNNIHFYEAVDCPVEQSVSLAQGWNWWSPIVEITLADLETALGTNGIAIIADGVSVEYENGAWSGSLQTIVPGQMVMIRTNADCTFTLSGAALSNVSVTIDSGLNWFGYPGTEELALENIGITPADGDKIVGQDEGFAIYEEGSGWTGTLGALQPGHGYVYLSNATESKTMVLCPAQ